MDDFGSGYSSLNMLKEAPVDEIKLDMRFLSAADPYGRAEEILHMIITMGKSYEAFHHCGRCGDRTAEGNASGVRL